MKNSATQIGLRDQMIIPEHNTLKTGKNKRKKQQKKNNQRAQARTKTNESSDRV